MAEIPQIRWLQRFNNYTKACNQLEKFISKGHLNELEQQGLIQAFEYTYELAWKTLQDLLKHQQYNDIVGPRMVIQQAFSDGYISDGMVWKQMLKDRNLSVHTYNETLTLALVSAIKERYYTAFFALKIRLDELADEQG